MTYIDALNVLGGQRILDSLVALDELLEIPDYVNSSLHALFGRANRLYLGG